MDKEFESRVRRTGQKLFQLMGGEVPPLFHKGSWTEKVLAQCVKDEGFKTDFLRFMDVLPSLKQANSVAEHLGIFDRVIASTTVHNLKGGRKAEALVSEFGERGFDGEARRVTLNDD